MTRSEWHDLFWLVHSVCVWDDKVITAGSGSFGRILIIWTDPNHLSESVKISVLDPDLELLFRIRIQQKMNEQILFLN